MNNQPGFQSEFFYLDAIDFRSCLTEIEYNCEIEYLWINKNNNKMNDFKTTECVGFFGQSPYFGYFPGLIVTNTEGTNFKLWAVPHASLDLAIDAASKLNSSLLRMVGSGHISNFIKLNSKSSICSL